MGEKRELGEQEWLLHYLHRIGGLIATQVLHINGPLDPELVRRAFKWLQAQHPILRTHIEYGGLGFRSVPPFIYRKPSFVTDGTTEIPLAIVDNADPEHWRAVVAKELRTPIKRGNHPRLRAILVRETGNAALSHLVITADHATLDAQSGNMLSRQFMEYIADPQGMAAHQPIHTSLPPPLESGLPHKPDSGTRGYQVAMRLPNRPLAEPKMETRIIARHLDADATAKLKAAIKANRTTLHGAVTAAFLLGVRERYNELAEMTVLTTIDLRRLMKPALHAETYGCYIDILRTRHALGDDFWAMARDASFRLITTLAKDQNAASILKLFGWDTYKAEFKLISSHRRRIDGLAITTAGEFGLRRHYGAYELADVTMAVSLDTFGPSLFVIASEREGGIDLSIGYSAFAISDEEASALAEASLRRLHIAA